MKKLFNYLLLSLLFIPFINVKAASGVIDIYTSNKTPAPGNTFTVTVYCKSSSTIGTCEYTLSYDTSKVKFVSAGDTVSCNGNYCNYYVGSKSSSKKFTFKAIANGSTTISAKSVGIIGMDEKNMSSSISPTTLTIKTPEPAKPVTYSTNNYLSSLKVDGYDLSPKFNKNTNEYKLSLNADVEEINITAKKEDSTAKVSGTGKKQVSLGNNKFDIVVTSEKGTKRTYTINIEVVDKNPINVTIDDKEYSIVKKKSTLTKPDNYIDKEITIKEQTIPAFYSEITNFTLVGLKDKNGTVNLYIYDENSGTYSLYKEYQFNSIKISPITTNEIIEGYKEDFITLNDEKIKAYKTDTKSKYALIYGINLESGDKGWYEYEETENTIQKYNLNDNNNKLLEEKLESAKQIIYALSGVILFLSLLVIIVAALKTKNKKKKITKLEKNNLNNTLVKTTKEIKEIDEKELYDTKKIKKILDKELEKENKPKKKIKKVEKILDEW